MKFLKVKQFVINLLMVKQIELKGRKLLFYYVDNSRPFYASFKTCEEAAEAYNKLLKFIQTKVPFTFDINNTLEEIC